MLRCKEDPWEGCSLFGGEHCCAGLHVSMRSFGRLWQGLGINFADSCVDGASNSCANAHTIHCIAMYFVQFCKHVTAESGSMFRHWQHWCSCSEFSIRLSLTELTRNFRNFRKDTNCHMVAAVFFLTSFFSYNSMRYI